MNTMTRTQFIISIFRFFKIQDDNGDLFRVYETALKTSYQINWEAFYNDIIKTAEKRILPLPKFFVDKLSYFRIFNNTTDGEIGEVTRVLLKNGHYYDFVTCIEAKHSITDIQRQLEGQIESIVVYPKEVTLIGNDVHWNIYIKNIDRKTEEEIQKERNEKISELEKRIKTIYICKK